MEKGLFIAMYGVNNIGKSTHCRILSERLKREGYEVVQLKYPIYESKTGELLNIILREKELPNFRLENGHLVEDYHREDLLQELFTQNRKDFEPTLKKYIDEGKIIIAEDYTGTGIAWGMAKGLPLEFMEKINDGLLREDFSMMITGHRDARATEKHHIHEQNQQLLSSVSKIFVQLSQRYKWHVIDLQQNIPDTADLIWNTVKDFIHQRKKD